MTTNRFLIMVLTTGCLLAGGWWLVSCTNPRQPAGQTLPSAMTLTGIWTKQTQSDCGQRYPAQIEFKANNLYEARADANATLHPVWDLGTWSLEDHQLKVSTSNDAIVSYAVSLTDRMLTINDPDGCTLEYRKK